MLKDTILKIKTNNFSFEINNSLNKAFRTSVLTLFSRKAAKKEIFTTLVPPELLKKVAEASPNKRHRRFPVRAGIG